MRAIFKVVHAVQHLLVLLPQRHRDLTMAYVFNVINEQKGVWLLQTSIS